MAVIKSQQVPQAAAAFSMRDIEFHARALVQRAQQQAEEILIAAQIEAETLRAKAHADGHAAGKKEGHAVGLKQGEAAGKTAAFEEAREQLSTQSAALIRVVTDINADREALQQQATSEVLELAVAIARRVTKRQGLLDPAVVAANTFAAVKLVVNKADLRVALHPSQKQLLEELLPKMKQVWPQLLHVELVEDVSLAPGGCRVTTAAGEINADIDYQLDRIAAELLPDLA